MLNDEELAKPASKRADPSGESALEFGERNLVVRDFVVVVQSERQSSRNALVVARRADGRRAVPLQSEPNRQRTLVSIGKIRHLSALRSCHTSRMFPATSSMIGPSSSTASWNTSNASSNRSQLSRSNIRNCALLTRVAQSERKSLIQLEMAASIMVARTSSTVFRTLPRPFLFA